MLKKRLIFTLLIENDVFMLSRNFSLQSVGSLGWIRENYDFDSISASVDELVVLNVGKSQDDLNNFSENLIKLAEGCFVPIAAGGGIRKMSDGELLLNSGADKLVVNRSIIDDPDLVRALVEKYGSQCVVASVDYKKVDGQRMTFVGNGTKPTGLAVEDFVKTAEKLKVGEIYLTSMDQDGTGMGYDLEMIKRVVELTKIPVIASGGAGHYKHFVEVIKHGGVMAISTANLFNFMAGGIRKTREHMIKEGIDLARWDISSYELVSVPLKEEKICLD